MLDTLPSGDSSTLASGTVVHPIATFTNGEGKLCREFETEGASSYLVVSCRAGSDWSFQLALGTAEQDGNYRPASSFDVLDAYLQASGAGAPLTGDDELAALRSKAP